MSLAPFVVKATIIILNPLPRAQHLMYHESIASAAAIYYLPAAKAAQLAPSHDPNAPYLTQQCISLFFSLPSTKPLDCTKQHEMLSASQVVPQHVKLGADPHQPPHPVQTPLVNDAATMHHCFPSCGGQDAGIKKKPDRTRRGYQRGRRTPILSGNTLSKYRENAICQVSYALSQNGPREQREQRNKAAAVVGAVGKPKSNNKQHHPGHNEKTKASWHCCAAVPQESAARTDIAVISVARLGSNSARSTITTTLA
ncbi:MAG: hypothetical protein FRX49_10249 [Trebouxia sp. A1-2]|nr:MAG: hypothetical protein FRX49_10249 [Trebouxia sp. A1-2]